MIKEVVAGTPASHAPAHSWLTEPFWSAVENDGLVIPHCNECGQYFFRPEEACTYCQSRNWEWRRSQGAGTLHSFTVVHRAPFPGHPAPFVLGVVHLDEGVYLLSRILEDHPERLSFDCPVRLTFDRSTGVKLPAFELGDM
ncbi:MAG: Zn-ribbon domain-containing OB-fold protein [Candidatus Nanopelagicales bacterium]